MIRDSKRKSINNPLDRNYMKTLKTKKIPYIYYEFEFEDIFQN